MLIMTTCESYFVLCVGRDRAPCPMCHSLRRDRACLQAALFWIIGCWRARASVWMGLAMFWQLVSGRRMSLLTRIIGLTSLFWELLSFSTFAFTTNIRLTEQQSPLPTTRPKHRQPLGPKPYPSPSTDEYR